MPNGCPPLYDIASMLEMDASLAQGFLILLSGDAQEQPQKGPSQQTIMLGFAALTDGNVIDACFGVGPQRSSANATPQATTCIKNAKAALASAGDNSSKIPKLAVNTFSKAFRILLQYHQDVKKLNFITKCFKMGSLQASCQKEMEETFGALQEAVRAAN